MSGKRQRRRSQNAHRDQRYQPLCLVLEILPLIADRDCSTRRVEVTAAVTDPKDSYDPQKLDNQLEPVAGKCGLACSKRWQQFVTRRKQASDRDHDVYSTAFSCLQPVCTMCRSDDLQLLRCCSHAITTCTHERNYASQNEMNNM